MQFNFFDDAGDERERNILEGFRYRSELIGPAQEDALLTHLGELPFKEFDFHGYKGKRRVVSFGWQYDFAGGGLRKADDIPQFLRGLRELAASFAHLDPEAFQQVLVTEYGPGAGIGWHRDKPDFGEVVGISLLAPCVLRFRRKVKVETSVSRDKERKQPSAPTEAIQNARRNLVKAQLSRLKLNSKWDRVNVLAEPRSAYHLTGPARSTWEHSILRVDALRYSITFRNLRSQVT